MLKLHSQHAYVAHTSEWPAPSPAQPHLVAAALAHVLEVKPALKVAQAAEDVGHQEVEQGPQLRQVVLQGGAWGQRRGQGDVSRWWSGVSKGVVVSRGESASMHNHTRSPWQATKQEIARAGTKPAWPSLSS